MQPTRTSYNKNPPRCTRSNARTPLGPLLLLLRTSQRLLLHRLLKHLERQRGLVVRHLVPGPKHPQEAQVVDRLDRAALLALDGVGGQGFGREGGGARVGDGVGGGEAAEPVADPVGVAGPEDDADAALDDGREGREEVAGVCVGGGEKLLVWRFVRRGEKGIGLTVACGGELVVRIVGAFRVG